MSKKQYPITLVFESQNGFGGAYKEGAHSHWIISFPNGADMVKGGIPKAKAAIKKGLSKSGDKLISITQQ